MSRRDHEGVAILFAILCAGCCLTQAYRHNTGTAFVFAAVSAGLLVLAAWWGR